MKAHTSAIVRVLAAGLVTFSFLSFAEAGDKGTPEKKGMRHISTEKEDRGKIEVKGGSGLGLFTYRPPKRGTPGGRIGGGTRGETGGYPIISEFFS